MTTKRRRKKRKPVISIEEQQLRRDQRNPKIVLLSVDFDFGERPVWRGDFEIAGFGRRDLEIEGALQLIAIDLNGTPFLPIDTALKREAWGELLLGENSETGDGCFLGEVDERAGSLLLGGGAEAEIVGEVMGFVEEIEVVVGADEFHLPGKLLGDLGRELVEAVGFKLFPDVDLVGEELGRVGRLLLRQCVS